MYQFESDSIGQFESDKMGQAKSESIDQCDRILQRIENQCAERLKWPPNMGILQGFSANFSALF